MANMKSFILALVFCLVCLATSSVAFTPAVARFNVARTVLALAEDETPAAAPAESKPPLPCPDCDRCDGSGRILGGIGVVLPWWPIKAYRPCPNFIERGGTYQRSGQGLDEIAFGRDSTFGGGKK